MQQGFHGELEALIDTMPPHIQEPLRRRDDLDGLLEVVLDLGREPEARFLDERFVLDSRDVTKEDIEHVSEHIGSFGEDNRAGIERTLHRISAIRNRYGQIVGLTLRVGRAVYGTIRILEDLIFVGKSVLLLGRPGVGKTTMLREVARVLADDAHKRVIVVDTSNEIAGDGDIPHHGIGQSRRMQVPAPALQHAVMIEAVENHMPEVIVIDEIGTEPEANAARTIAERGVQLVATAHGNTLENLIRNPTLSDLVGGIQSVTLGDIEARRRRTQKTVLERRAPPTFDILVEIQGWDSVVVHSDVAEMVDRMLRGFPIPPETRTIDQEGKVHRAQAAPRIPATPPNSGGLRSFGPPPEATQPNDAPQQVTDNDATQQVTHILPYGVNKGKLQQAVQEADASVKLVVEIEQADLLLTTKNYYKRNTQPLRTAEQQGKPVFVLRKNTLPQIEQFVQAISRKSGQPQFEARVSLALKEAQEAVGLINRGEVHVDLNPQGSHVRRLQHQIAEKYRLGSASIGREPRRHVVFHRRT